MYAKEYLKMYLQLQLDPFVHLPCPRCGKALLNEKIEENPVSRYADVPICEECGIREALLDQNHTQMPLDSWFAVRFLSGTPPIDRVPGSDGKASIYQIPVLGTVDVTEEDISDIMTTALEGGIVHWCGRVEMTGAHSKLSIEERLAKGESLTLHDMKSEKTYTLTCAALLNGLRLFLNDIPRSCVYNGKLDTSEIDADDADSIIQLAVFGRIVYG